MISQILLVRLGLGSSDAFPKGGRGRQELVLIRHGLGYPKTPASLRFAGDFLFCSEMPKTRMYFVK